MLSAGLGTINFSWAASPSCTELETIVLDWLAKMLNLPPNFNPKNPCCVTNTINSLAELDVSDSINERNNEEIDDDVANDNELFFESSNSGGGVILVN